jgi:hypothetical protein
LVLSDFDAVAHSTLAALESGRMLL